ncbi:MAG TPA: DUF2339 domain-containing protein, partial [Verrucomicrobiae bacterium]|nr:DUF2339 domain-containing protein [Verrucomicrobiae bacterium]
RKSRVLTSAAYVAAALAVAWGLDGILEHESQGMWRAMFLGALMLLNALLAARTSASRSILRAGPSYFVLLALAVWFGATWNNSGPDAFPLVIASEGLLLTLSIYLVALLELALLGQSYVIIAHAAWFSLYWLGTRSLPPWPNAVLLMAITLTLNHWWQRQQKHIQAIPWIYRSLACALTIWWIAEYIPERERIWVYALCGLGLLLLAWRSKTEPPLIFAAVFTLVWLVDFWAAPQIPSTVYFPNLLAIAALLAEERLLARLRGRSESIPHAATALLIAGCATLWLFVSRAVLEQDAASWLTVSWSGLALVLFACGIRLRERFYRWAGLVILGCAMGRVLIVDVWKLDVIYRVLSFMALGIVLVALGFIYSKYQEKIREWL